jgi:hypothetical protein
MELREVELLQRRFADADAVEHCYVSPRLPLLGTGLPVSPRPTGRASRAAGQPGGRVCPE